MQVSNPEKGLGKRCDSGGACCSWNWRRYQKLLHRIRRPDRISGKFDFQSRDRQQDETGLPAYFLTQDLNSLWVLVVLLALPSVTANQRRELTNILLCDCLQPKLRQELHPSRFVDMIIIYCTSISIHTENIFGRTMGWIKGLTRPLASTREKSISVRRLNRIF